MDTAVRLTDRPLAWASTDINRQPTQGMAQHPLWREE